MAITSETISGSTILNEVQSSNIVRTQYDTITKKMIAEFKNGIKYEYDDVPHQKYKRRPQWAAKCWLLLEINLP